jgi:hypothetical protein
MTRSKRTFAAAVLSLGLAGCVGGSSKDTSGDTGTTTDTTITGEPEYGVTITDYTDADADADADTDVDTDADTDADTDPTTGTSGDTGGTGGVLYGAPP